MSVFANMLVLAALFDGSTAGIGQDAQPQLGRDTRGCIVPGTTHNSEVVIESTVPCVNGTNEGYGELRFSRNGVTTWKLVLSRDTALVFRDNRLKLDWNAEDLELRVLACKRTGAAKAAAIVPDSLPLYLDWVAYRVLDAAYSKLDRNCPLPSGSRYYRDVKVFRASANIPTLEALWYPKYGSVSCNHYGAYPAKTTRRGSSDGRCSDVINNYAANSYSRGIKEVARSEQAVIKATRAVDLSQRQFQEAVLAAQQREARVADLEKRFSQFSIVTISEITPNPFAWKGKMVGICTSFSRMVGPNTGVFGSGSAMVVTGVPSTRYQQAASNQFLVGRVSGQASGLPSVQYLAALDGGGAACDHYVPNGSAEAAQRLLQQRQEEAAVAVQRLRESEESLVLAGRR